MRVLAITSSYSCPGGDRMVPSHRQLFRLLAGHHELRVVEPIPWTGRSPKVKKTEQSRRGYRNEDGIWVYHPTFYFPPRLLDHRLGQFYYRSIHKTVERILEQFPARALLSCGPFPEGWAAAQIAREAGLPHLLKVSAHHLNMAGYSRLQQGRVAEALREADRIVVESQFLADQLARLGVDADAIHVLMDGFEQTTTRSRNPIPEGWADSRDGQAQTAACSGRSGDGEKVSLDRTLTREQAAQALAEQLHALVPSSAAEIHFLNDGRPHPGPEMHQKVLTAPSHNGRHGRLRVLAITSLYPRLGHDGIAPYNCLQFRALACKDDLRLIAPVSWTDRLRDLWKLDPRASQYVNKDGIWVYHPTYYFPPRVLSHRYGQYYLRSIERTVQQVLDHFQPQVLVGCWAHPDGWATVQLARQAGLPVLIKVHGSDVLVATQEEKRRKWIAETLCGADSVVAVSRDLADHIVRLGVAPHKVHVIPNGIDGNLFCPGDQHQARARLGLPAKEKILLFVGELLFSKGAGILIEACGLLRAMGVPFQCYLVGQGRHESRLRPLLRKMGLSQWVSLAGPCSHQTLPDWYRACDLVVLPSFSEGIPNVLREAMMCGKPYVATNVGGIPEISHPAYSRLIAPGGVQELAEAINEMLVLNPTVDQKIVGERHISWEQSAQLLAEQLQALIGNQVVSSVT